MGCMSPRRPQLEVRPEQKWDAISLNDFKSTSCFTPFAYAYLYFSLLLSCAVYGVDTFTAVNLIAFNRWSSEIAPTQLIPFSVSRWIFAVCIILGFINLAFEHIRARRIMKRGSVAECYLDSLAVRLESVRMGRGQGWKRFLVFAELTKSKKGAEYVALFTYFSFQSWIRVIICSGPRQAVNALTLLAVYNAKLSASGTTLENTLLSFFDKIRALALEDSQQALILCGMLFTLVIWVFSFLSLLLGAVFFVFFLWGYIPRSDGGLSAYCERKINKRLMKIVSAKINKAMAEDERRRRKAELKAAKKAGEIAPTALQATLPDVGDDKLPEMPMLGRNDTMTTLPAYTSRPGTPGSFELNSLDQKRPVPSRTMTASSSATAYSARAPLMGAAAELGINRTASPAPSLPSVDLNNYPPARTGTSNSNRNFGPMQPNRGPTNGYDGAYTASPATYSSETMPALPPPIRSPLGAGNGYGRPPPPNQYNGRSTPNGSRPPPFDEYSSGMSSPAPSGYSSPRGPISPRGPAQGGYPVRSATNPVPPRGPGSPYAPQRNMTAPIQPQHQASSSGASDYFNRPNTASSQRGFQPQHQNTGSSASDYRPPTSQSQRGVNRPGFGNGWAGDVEAQRGPGPRY